MNLYTNRFLGGEFLKKGLKFILCFLLNFSFLFTTANVAFAVDEEKLIESKMITREVHNAVYSSKVNLDKYIPDLKAFTNDILLQLMTDNSNLTDSENYGYIDLSKYKLPADVDLFETICEYIFYESPELFRVTGIMADVGGRDESFIVGLKGSYIYKYPEDFVADYNAMVKKANEMLEGIEGNDSLSDVEKALLLHDRIALFCEYDVENLEKDTLPDKAFNAYGVLGTGVAVCMGYALAYDYLLERVGIESQYCSSNALNHAWNIVYINNKPYHVDITWDDVTNDVSGQVWHDNFLRSTAGIKETGHKYGRFGRTDYITTPTDTTYDNYFWQDSITAFQLLNDKIYYIDSDFATEDVTEITGKLIVLDDINDRTPQVITTITDTWKKVENDSTWAYNFSKLACGNGLLYYSKPTSVYSYNPLTDEHKLVITPEEVSSEIKNPENVIYGLRMDGCILSGEYATTPNYELTTKKENLFSRALHSVSENWTVIVSGAQEKAARLCVNCDCVLEEGHASLAGTHNWGGWYNDPDNTPTCTKSGRRISNCLDDGCDIYKIEYISASGHNYSKSWTVDSEANCVEIGVKSHHCTKCGLRKDITQIPINDKHTSCDKWLVGESLTCTTSGYNYKVCINCGIETERQMLWAKGHQPITVNEKAVTCTTNGYTGDEECKNCGILLKKGSVITAPGHKLGVWIIASYPTTEKVGYKYRECTVCNTIVEGKDIKKVKVLPTPEVKIVNATSGIKVSWVDIENAESYIIYRRSYNPSTKKWSGWSKVKTNVTATSYVDKTVKLGSYYRYTVRAKNGNVLSAYKTTSTLKYNVTPTVKVANASNGVKVTWAKVANATGYTVYSSTYNTKTKKWSSWEKRGTANATRTSWVDKKAKSGVCYKYTVRAVYGNIKSSYNKSGVATIFLNEPTVKIANNANGIKVSWSKVSGSKGYTVYRQEIVNGKWSSWTTLGTANNTRTSWVDESVYSGVTYRYTVRVINGKYKSSYKATSALVCLSQPDVTVTAANKGVNVSWSECAGATGYTVYRSELVNGKWSNWTILGTAPKTETLWADKSAKKGITYCYTVRAVNGNSKSSYYAVSIAI